jgi:hypothetical protein
VIRGPEDGGRATRWRRVGLASAACAVLGVVVAAPAQALIYWAEVSEGGSTRLGRADLDGSNVDEQYLPSNSGSPLAVDGQSIYWAAGNTIQKGRLDLGDIGETPDNAFLTDVSSQYQHAFVQDLAVSGDHIYWLAYDSTPPGYGSIGRANLDGSGVQRDLIAGAFSAPFPGNVQSYSLDVDGSHIYRSAIFTTCCPGLTYHIVRSNLDGSGQEDFIPYGGGDVAVDGEHIFWAGGSGIGRASINGEGADPLFSGLYPGFSLEVHGSYLYFPGPNGLTRLSVDGTQVTGFPNIAGGNFVVDDYTFAKPKIEIKRVKKNSAKRSAKVTFKSDSPNKAFECRLDTLGHSPDVGHAKPCKSPVKLKHLRPHTKYQLSIFGESIVGAEARVQVRFGLR